MARLLGRYTRPWCPYHRAPAGMDCPDSSPSKRTQRAYEERQWRREAEDEMSEEQDKQAKEREDRALARQDMCRDEEFEAKKQADIEWDEEVAAQKQAEQGEPTMEGLIPTYQILDEAAEYAETGKLRDTSVGPGRYPETVSLEPKATGVAEAVAERMRRKPTWLRTSNRREALERATQLAAGGYGGENAQEVIADAREFEAYLNEVPEDIDD